MIVWKSNRISDVVIRHPSLRCERRERNSKKLPSRACFAPKSKTARPVRSNSRLRLVGQRLSTDKNTIKTDKKQRRTSDTRAALEAGFEKQYDNRKAPGIGRSPELLYYF